MNQINNVDQLMRLADASFIQEAYQLLLGRKPDVEGMNFYLKNLQDGGLKSKLVRDIASSEEAKTHNSPLIGLKNIVTFHNNFSEATDSIDKILYLNGAPFVEYCYYFLLGRKPDIEGFDYYYNKMESGYAKSSIIMDIFNAAEYSNRKINIFGIYELIKKEKKENHWLFGIFIRRKKINCQINRIERLILTMQENINNDNYRIALSQTPNSVYSPFLIKTESNLASPGKVENGWDIKLPSCMSMPVNAKKIFRKLSNKLS